MLLDIVDCSKHLHLIAVPCLPQLEDVHFILEKYLERFHNLLGHGNRRYIQTLLVITQGFLRALREDCKDTASCHEDAEKFSSEKLRSDSSMAINDFLFALNIDNINLLKLLDYIKESNVIHKVVVLFNKGNFCSLVPFFPCSY